MLSLASLFMVLTPPFAGGGEPESEASVRAHVRAVQEGDADAAVALYHATVGPLFRIVRPLVRTDADAEDVLQETYARALEAIGRYREEPRARFVSWLAAIAINLVRRRHRGGRRVVVSSELAERAAEEVPFEGDVGTELDAARRRAALMLALSELDEREREVVTLRYGGELRAREVATACGLSEANVRKICERQRAVLSNRIRELLDEPVETTTVSHEHGGAPA